MSAARLLELAQARGVMVATAESCTGGLVAAAITDIPGSSAVFERGFVTYTNAAKQEMLGVDAATLADHGAVSEAVACAMAEGALARSAAQLAVSVTGIAGPDGGTPDKPVGTVCFGWAGPDDNLVTATLWLGGDRDEVRRKSVAAALEGVLEHGFTGR